MIALKHDPQVDVHEVPHIKARMVMLLNREQSAFPEQSRVHQVKMILGMLLPLGYYSPWLNHLGYLRNDDIAIAALNT